MDNPDCPTAVTPGNGELSGYTGIGSIFSKNIIAHTTIPDSNVQLIVLDILVWFSI